MLCDADLAVLGGDATEYAQYAADIREEYAHVDDDAFRAGRIAVLQRLLEKQPLYCTIASAPIARSRRDGTWRRSSRCSPPVPPIPSQSRRLERGLRPVAR